MHSNEKVDIAIVGAGIVGLAHALEAAKQGYAVRVFERNRRPLGASIRNFGMILPLGMKPGIQHDRALRSRAIWQTIIRETGLWHSDQGVMVPAYHADEQRAMEEFIAWGPSNDYAVSWLNAAQATDLSPVNAHNLRGALYSSIELLINPKEALDVLVEFLRTRYNVRFDFNTVVTAVDAPALIAGGQEMQAERVVVCCGSDFQTLYPTALAGQPAKQCKLQMMQTKPQASNWSLGPFLATGLSLTHYASFAACPSVHDIRNRVAEDCPDLIRWGIHLLVAQYANGQLVIGDSHVYDDMIDPFDDQEIDQLIMDYVPTFLTPPTLEIDKRWHGIYTKTETGEPLILAPAPHVRIVTGLGGGGMTTSFALAQDVFEAWN